MAGTTLEILIKARDEASRNVTKLGKNFKSLDAKMKVVGERMKKMGKQFLVAGGVMSAALGLMLKGAAKNELAMARMIAQVDRANVNTKALEKTAKKLFRTNSDTLPQITAVLTKQTQVWGDLGEITGEVAQATLDFAQVNQIEAGPAVETVTSFMRAFGETGKDTTRVVDLLTAGSQRLGVSSFNLARMATTSAGALVALGLNAEKSIGFLSAMQAAGVNVSLALTGIRSAAIKFKTPAEFRFTLEALADMEDMNKRVRVATEKFGTFAGPGLAKLLGKGIEALDEMMLSYADVAGASAESAAIIEATLSEQIGILWNIIQDLRDVAIKPLLNDLTRLSKFVSGVVVKMRDWIAEHPTLSKWIGRITAGLSVLLLVLGSILIPLGFLASGFTALTGILTVVAAKFALVWTAIMGPVGLVAAFVAAGIAITSFASKNIDFHNTLTKTESVLMSNTQMLGTLKIATEKAEEEMTEFEKALEMVADPFFAAQLEGLSKELESIQKFAELTREELVKLEQQFTEATIAEEERRAGIRTSIAERVLAQEELIAQLRKEIEQAAVSVSGEAELAKFQNLQARLVKEKASLEKATTLGIDLTEALKEARRKATLTEFERFLEDIVKKDENEREQFETRVALMQEEIAKTKEKLAAILESETETFDKITDLYEGQTNTAQIESDKQVAIVEKAAEQILDKWGAVRAEVSKPIPIPGFIGGGLGGGLLGATPFQEGGVVTRPTLGLLGEAGPEAVVPLDRGLGRMGRLIVNITGNTIVGGDADEVARVIGDALINRLNLQMRIG